MTDGSGPCCAAARQFKSARLKETAVGDLREEDRGFKAEKLKAKLPSGVGSTTFDRTTGKYVVTFTERVEEVM